MPQQNTTDSEKITETRHVDVLVTNLIWTCQPKRVNSQVVELTELLIMQSEWSPAAGGAVDVTRVFSCPKTHLFYQNGARTFRWNLIEIGSRKLKVWSKPKLTVTQIANVDEPAANATRPVICTLLLSSRAWPESPMAVVWIDLPDKLVFWSNNTNSTALVT